jgi:hypothetical protein
LSASSWRVGLIEIKASLPVGDRVATIAHELMHLIMGLLPALAGFRTQWASREERNATEEVLCEAMAVLALRRILEDPARSILNCEHPLRVARATLAQYLRDPCVSVGRIHAALGELWRAHYSPEMDATCARIAEEIAAARNGAPVRTEGIRTMTVGNRVVTFGLHGRPRPPQ